jgi:hypothetical protein
MSRAIERIDGPDCFAAAKRRARFGHREWIWWRDAHGEHAARVTAESLKEALLAAAWTKGKWTLISSDGTLIRGFWWLGVNMTRIDQYCPCLKAEAEALQARGDAVDHLARKKKDKAV